LPLYGRAGAIVTKEITDCLNLRPGQAALVTTASTFAMLGGDSLAATRVVRAIYARHHNVVNNRFLGGEYGVLEGPFAVIHLLRAKDLGAYVEWLDDHNVFNSDSQSEDPVTELEGRQSTTAKVLTCSDDRTGHDAERLYNALLQATTSKCTNVAMALLDVGADPNHGENGGRIGKTSGRMERMKTFQSSPLHLACLHGEARLLKKLLEKNAKHNTPNASSLFPLHLAACGEFHEVSTDEEDERRLLCVKYLLEAGTPITIQDGSKQTVLHAAARAGHVKVLRFVLERWIAHFQCRRNLDLRDVWSRTPVHWAVLNSKVDALAVLIEMGCSSSPAKPKENSRRTSAAVESPMEICLRLYDEESQIGKRIRSILEGSSNMDRSLGS
jgi:Ankyrin repeats (3 copies)